ncbi:NERD domain-containing protein [Salicibibacter halophilus]|uniref:NERD domain-containing protein n=1 Tax=Salicibibacter halophilus TaxID=2502791 RepID=A0A514LIU7_9BACI|nr:nuclease-related domain-containing protein [Salicibibacter halophilus]QDI91455.1 NERD domain-containing protein [Salicibibacter halophilus]
MRGDGNKAEARAGSARVLSFWYTYNERMWAMIIKEREEPFELKILRLLNPRMTLPDKQHFSNLEKGYEGELQLDVWLEDLKNESLIVNDLLLKHKQQLFQIDTLLIFSNKIYLFNVKYYEGDYYTEHDKWYVMSGKEINDPLLQLKRSDYLLRQLFQSLKMNFLPVEPLLIFIHPAFMLYNASHHLPAVFPSQLQRYMNKLNREPSKINRKHEHLAERLATLHEEKPPHTDLPDYDFDQLEKGVVCAKCSKIVFFTAETFGFRCGSCGHEETFKTGLLRSIEEFKMLFPEKKITTPAIIEWCALKGDKKKVSRILGTHYKRVGSGRYTHFIDG